MLVHYAYQNHHIRPAVYMGVATINDLVSNGEQAFMVASDKKAFADGYTPIMITHFSKKKEANNG